MALKTVVHLKNYIKMIPIRSVLQTYIFTPGWVSRKKKKKKTYVSHIEFDGFGCIVNLLPIRDVAVVGPTLASGFPHEFSGFLDTWSNDKRKIYYNDWLPGGESIEAN